MAPLPWDKVQEDRAHFKRTDLLQAVRTFLDQDEHDSYETWRLTFPRDARPPSPPTSPGRPDAEPAHR